MSRWDRSPSRNKPSRRLKGETAPPRIGHKTLGESGAGDSSLSVEADVLVDVQDRHPTSRMGLLERAAGYAWALAPHSGHAESAGSAATSYPHAKQRPNRTRWRRRPHPTSQGDPTAAAKSSVLVRNGMGSGLGGLGGDTPLCLNCHFFGPRSMAIQDLEVRTHSLTPMRPHMITLKSSGPSSQAQGTARFARGW